MVGDEFSEGAKAAKESAIAVQEVAKVARSGIEATEKLGGFVSELIGEPLEQVVGLLTDKLRYVRWERQQRLTRQALEFIRDKNINEPLRIIQPKIALPIIENASIEENDELQDLWARLLASAVDPNFCGEIRSAFIDIIKQLEVADVHILNLLYKHYESATNRDHDKVSDEELYRAYIAGEGNYTPIEFVFDESKVDGKVEPQYLPLSIKSIVTALNISSDTYKESIDNLIRLGCVASFIGKKQIEIPKQSGFRFPTLEGKVNSVSARSGFRSLSTDKIQIDVDHAYDRVCLTHLGLSFSRACINKSNKVQPGSNPGENIS